MSRRRPGGERVTEDGMGREDRRRSEAGDTLVEILISLAVIGIAATAIMLAFATTISSSGVHRNLVTMDTMLRTASAEVSAAISQQPATTFAGCSGAYQINQGVQPYTVNAGTIPLPSASYAATISDGVVLEHLVQQPESCRCAGRYMPHWSNRWRAAVADGLRAVQARWRRHAAASHDHECCRQPELGDGGVDLWYAGSTALGGATRQRQCRDGSLPTAHARDRGCQ